MRWSLLGVSLIVCVASAAHATCDGHLLPKQEDIESKLLVWENGRSFSQDPLFAEAIRTELRRSGKPVFQGFLKELDWKGLLASLPSTPALTFTPAEARLRRASNEFYLILKGEPSPAFTGRGAPAIRPIAIIELKPSTFARYWHATRKNRLHKFSLKKTWNGRAIEFSYFPIHDLVTAEIEYTRAELFENKAPFDLNQLRPFGLNVTENSRYQALSLTH